MNNQKVKGRVYTEEEKKALLQRVLTVWLQYNDIRLGQLLVNAMGPSGSLFYEEDTSLCEKLEKFLAEHPPKS